MEIGKTGIIVTASDDTTLKTWTMDKPGCTQTFHCHDDTAVDIAQFGEQHIITVSRDKSAKVVRVSDGKVEASVDSLHELLSCISVSDKIAIVGDEAGNLFKVEWVGSELKEVDNVDKAHSGEIWNMYKKGDAFITCSEDGTIKIWDSDSMTELHSIDVQDGKPVYSVVYDDNYIVTATLDGTIFVYDAQTYGVLSTIRTHTRAVQCVRIIKNKSIIVSGGVDRCIALHSLPRGELIAKQNVQMAIHSISVLSSCKIAIAGARPNQLKIVDIEEMLKSKQIIKPTSSQAVSNKQNIIPSPQKLSRTKREFVALVQFKKAAERGGKEVLLMNEATEALNTALEAVDIDRKLSIDEFESIFLEITNELEVSEQSFLQVFKRIISNFDSEVKKRYATEYENTFNKFVKDREATSIPYATRVLQRVYAELKSKGILKHKSLGQEEFSTELMSTIRRHGSGKVNQHHFVEAALSILHGVEPKSFEQATSDRGSRSCTIS